MLIEFAFAIPVFLVLMYYIHDLPKQKLLQRKVQFVAYEMSAIMQNIATQRANNEEQITKSDVHHALKLAYLSIFPGNTLYAKASNCYPLGYFAHSFVYCVKGVSENNASIQWLLSSYGYSVKNTTSMHVGSTISTWSGTATSIHPNLTINSDEIKIICECCLYYPWNDKVYSFTNGTKCVDVPVKDAFGFLFINPVSRSQNKENFFTGVSIFSPVTGFSTIVPQ